MKRKVFAMIIALAMIASLNVSVLADMTMRNGNVGVEVTMEDDFNMEEAFKYANAPDGLYPFLYTGSEPLIWIDINANVCEIGKLYVYNEATTEVIKISDDTVTTYATTQDALFYVTTDKTVVQTNYSGSDLTTIYTATYGEITNFTPYGTYLYFVEGDGNAMLFDTLTLTAKVLLSDKALVTFFMVDVDKMIWYSMGDVPHYFNASSGENYELANEAEANFIVGTYVNSKLGGATGEYSTDAVILSTGYNNVSIPFSDYPAVAEKGDGYAPTTVLSRFTGTYASSSECDGFAKLAHDRFFHIEDTTRNGPSWSTSSSDYHGKYTWSSTSAVKTFFMGLKMGDFIRYTSKSDQTPYNGTHSVFFVGLDNDGNGFWVYECNQDWNLGIGYQYYTFTQIYNNYAYALYYINHTFSNIPTYYSITYHDLECQYCDGCLRRNHTSVSITQLSAAKHQYTFACCGKMVAEVHDMLAGYCAACNYPNDPPEAIVIQNKLIEMSELEYSTPLESE